MREIIHIVLVFLSKSKHIFIFWQNFFVLRLVRTYRVFEKGGIYAIGFIGFSAFCRTCRIGKDHRGSGVKQ